MNFKQWFNINEEVYSQNKTATVFHRTCFRCDVNDSVNSVSGILTSKYIVGEGSGCLYGCGLYTTFALESQFSSYMRRYGHAVIKFKVTDLDKYLIFQLSVAKQIHGENYKISDQLKKLNIIDQFKESKQNSLQMHDERQQKEEFTGDFAYDFFLRNKWIQENVKGIIYRGKNDGFCLLKYQPVQDGTITMLGYAVADVDDTKKMNELKENKGWITSTEKAKIKDVYSLPDDQKSKYNFIDQFIAQNINKFSNAEVDDLIRNRYSWLRNLAYSDHVTDKIIDIYKDQIEKMIIKHKKELSGNNVKELLSHAQDKNQIAELLQQHTDNISKLSDKDVEKLLSSTKDKNQMVKIIIKHKKELSGNIVYRLLYWAKEIEEIAELLQKDTDNISKLSYKNVYDLYFNFRFNSSKLNKLTKALNKYHQNKTDIDIQGIIDYHMQRMTTN